MNRLLATEPTKYYNFKVRKWFDGPRHVCILPDPLNYVHYRTPEIEQEDVETGKSKQLELFSKTPFIFSNSQDISRTLVVDIVGLSLSLHPLMLQEQKLSLNLKKLLHLLAERKRKNIVWFLTEKLVSLRADCWEKLERLKKLRSDHSSNNISRRRSTLKKVPLSRPKKSSEVDDMEKIVYQCLLDIQSNRLLRDTEAQTDRLLEFRIVKTWEDIKKVRLDQGFQSTGVKLSIHIKDCKSEYNFEQEIENDVSERIEIHNIDKSRLKQEYLESLKKWERKMNEFKEKTSTIENLNTIKEDEEVEPEDNSEKSKNEEENAKMHPKPVEPDYPELNRQKIEVPILRRLKKAFSSSNSQSISFSFHNINSSITSTSECPNVSNILT